MVIHTSTAAVGRAILFGNRHSSVEKVEYATNAAHMYINDILILSEYSMIISTLQSLNKIRIGFCKQQRKRDFCSEHCSSNLAVSRQSYNSLWRFAALISVGHFAKCT